MKRFITIDLTLGLLLVALFGAGLFVMGCSGSTAHQLFGMGNCPQALSAVSHHINALLVALTGLIVVPFILRGASQRYAGCASLKNPVQTNLLGYTRIHLDAIAYHLPQQLFRRGILHRKDAPATIH